MDTSPLILFLPQWYPTKHEPFHGIFVRRHAQAVGAFTKVVVLYASADASIKKGLYYEEHHTESNVTEVHYYYRKHLFGIGLLDKLVKLFLYFYCSWKGYQKIKKTLGEPDLLHVHVMARAAIFAIVLRCLFKKKFVYTEHWGGYYPEDGNYKGILKAITPWCLSKAERILPVTGDLAKTMDSLGIHNKYEVVPNVVDTDRFVLDPTFRSAPTKIALHISNLDPKAKNVDGILEVVHLVGKQRKDFILNIVGYGDEEDRLKEKARQLGILDDRVFFLGAKKDMALIREIQKSDFLFMFSHYENQPCVIMEAFACGKPVLATPAGGIPEMITDKTGLLSPKKDVTQMAKKFGQMLDTCHDYDAEIIRAYAMGRYSYPVVGKRIADVYRQLLNG